MPAKPVIYLYPTKTQNIKVALDYKGNVFAQYPQRKQGENFWNAIAQPNGELLIDNKEYSYIFWEGIPEKEVTYNLETGFVIKGSESIPFLQEKLAYLGLSPKEYNEFIVCWYPKLQENKYNLIHFATQQYTDTAPLTITPKPDTLLRVFMVVKPLTENIKIKEQILEKTQRKGFTVVEWGGSFTQ
jgi:hypothetical protein